LFAALENIKSISGQVCQRNICATESGGGDISAEVIAWLGKLRLGRGVVCCHLREGIVRAVAVYGRQSRRIIKRVQCLVKVSHRSIDVRSRRKEQRSSDPPQNHIAWIDYIEPDQRGQHIRNAEQYHRDEEENPNNRLEGLPRY